MVHEPLTLAEARAICDEYKSLQGGVRLAGKGDLEVIEEVVIAPYGKLNKLLFFALYKEIRDPLKALEFYKHPEYDVILILRELVALGNGYFSHMDIRSYLEETGSYINIHSYQKP
jgi:hypothetical protein